jgi:Spy/CpxP family protein refolding chaperone
MKRILAIAFAALIPLALFAQAAPMAPAMQMHKFREADLLKSFQLSDAQIAQVKAIEQATRTTVKNDMVHLRLVRAQINDLLLTTDKPDVQAIDKLIDQGTQLRGEMQKALVAARIQLVQIMGKDNFEKYMHFVVRRLRGMMQHRRPMGPWGMGLVGGGMGMGPDGQGMGNMMVQGGPGPADGTADGAGTATTP